MLNVDLVSTVDPSLLASTGNNDSEQPSISSDGRYVAFQSGASNLVAGDANGLVDVFVRNVQTGATVVVSTAPPHNDSDRRRKPTVNPRSLAGRARRRRT
jgi:Tol biopolymer transport system component